MAFAATELFKSKYLVATFFLILCPKIALRWKGTNYFHVKFKQVNENALKISYVKYFSIFLKILQVFLVCKTITLSIFFL